ncbi:MAG: hypothetical protein PHR39_08655, partial [Actinomycetota bacterium]|nr:hypothetical protein [Actinomycetota bacterium]
MNIEQYRKDAEDFLSKIDKEYYFHFSGRKPDLNLDEIYKRYDYLFTFDNSRYFKELIDTSIGDNKKKARLLFQFCTEGYLSKKYQKISDKIANNEAISKIDIDGRDYAFRYSDILLSNEPDKSKRENIDSKRRKITHEVFNPDLKLYWESLHKEANELGFNNYTSLFEQLKGYDFYDLEKSMDKLVHETNGIYEEHMNKLFNKQLGFDIHESKASDFAFIKRAKEFDVFFKKENLVSIFKENMRLL